LNPKLDIVTPDITNQETTFDILDFSSKLKILVSFKSAHMQPRQRSQYSD